MPEDEPTITRQTARHVLHMFGQPGGAQPGRFTQHLINTIECADLRNAEILCGAYPELFAAVWLAKHDEDGITKLQAIAAHGQVAA